ncbi:hypothetical protein NGM99_08705 [Mesorhizobium sp. RP14(2022)]|uniref:Uncharacterized protein n=1 Tax=Mesorhizobium liriopis TaxID=2953882 RepID=A0ABT1C5C9_9HYPH|nr:hypothetical protein [Mesorhizobium liriopis]MCO6049873.1 hypothetical protein [Mesorhizobium liriopis]
MTATEKPVDVVPASNKKKDDQSEHSHIEHSVTEREALHKDGGDDATTGRSSKSETGRKPER